MDCRSSAALSESLDSTALPCAFSPAEDRHFERLLDGFNLDDVSISLDYGEMHASSALCEVGDVAACMAAAAAKKSPAAAAAQQHPSPSIINSPTWVRASLGAVTLAETTSNALWASPSTSMNSLGLNPHPVGAGTSRPNLPSLGLMSCFCCCLFSPISESRGIRSLPSLLSSFEFPQPLC